MASSSSAIDSCDNYDVFLSFRGEDTRYNFTSHLYDALRRDNIKVFIDYDIERGEEITPFLEGIIEGAKLSIIVFSSDYASSSFCLDELLKIMECRESKLQIVLPIFYKVEPSEATYQDSFDSHKANLNGNKSHQEDAIEQEMKKVEGWKLAFDEAVKLAGWHIDENSNEAEIIGKITTKVLEKLNSSQSRGEELIGTSMVGRRAKCSFKEIWNCLMNDGTLRVGVYGMGGVGKTTIVTHINNELLKSVSSFTHIYWETVSKDSSIYKLQTDIAKMIRLDLSKEDDQRKRAAKLWKELKSKKFVLILDDVWEAFELEVVGIPILVGSGKLLLTTRNLRVCERMECQPIEVKPLFEGEARDLFIKESRHKKNDSPEWTCIVESVVKECAGLPLAIVVLARRMRGVVEISEWRNVLWKLKKPCEGKNHEMDEQVFKPLKFSYDSLPDYQYRRCFLYCSLFPEDYKLRCNILIEYLIGEGLIDKLDSRQAEFDRGNAIINELVNASLLELHKYDEVRFFTNGEGKIQLKDNGRKSVKMHDVIRDMALIIRENSKAQDGLQLQGLSEETECCVNLKSVISMKDSMLERGVPNLEQNCSKFSTLIIEMDYSSNAKKFPSGFFANMQNLAVLDMSFLGLLKSLPDSIRKLGNLRVLRLSDCCKLKYIPSLAGLQNLCHLDLHYTDLKEIPNGMERLISLNVLKLTWTVSSSNVFFPCVDLRKLSHLQILHLQHVEVEPDVLSSLEKLETLKIVFYNLESLNSYLKSGHWQRLVEYYIVYFQSKERYVGEVWDEDTNKKVMFLDELRDFGGQKVETDIVLPNNVQHLLLEEWNGSMFDVPTKSTFVNLWELEWNGPMFDVLTKSTFVNLRELDIHWCEDMHLFTLALAQRFLGNVERLSIGRIFTMDKVEEIISQEDEFVSQINNNYTTVKLPKLKFLTLKWLTNLISIYKGRMVCPSLECLEIVGCGKLQRLPFCMQEERMILPPTKLVVRDVSIRWWDSLQWDDPNAKSRYQLDLKYCRSE